MIGIINYEAGNIFSLTAALGRLGIPFGMVNDVGDFGRYDRFIIPGVGHAGAAMEKLRAAGLESPIHTIKKPGLGICVGMLLLTAHSDEGDSDMLGIVPLRTLHFQGRVVGKVPHMGWNQVLPAAGCPLFRDIPEGSYFYFVHTYFIEYNATFTAALAHYGVAFSAALQQGNFYGVQFHPEKSGKAGE